MTTSKTPTNALYQIENYQPQGNAVNDPNHQDLAIIVQKQNIALQDLNNRLKTLENT